MDRTLDSGEIPCYLPACSLVLCSCLMTAPDGESRCGAKGKLPEAKNVSSGSLDTLRCTLYSARLA